MKQLLFSMICLSVFSSVFSQDWANFSKYENDNEIVKKLPADKRKVVFLGNSITEGWIKADSAFFKDNNFIDRGISGQVTSQMLVRFRKDVIDLQPKIVVILAGTNDIAENQGPIALDNIFGNIVSMAELAKLHKIKVVICSVTPASEYPWRKGKNPAVKIPELNTMLANYAKQNKIVFADYFSKMTNANNGLDPELSRDGVHPNLTGYKIMEEVILKSLKSIK